MNEMINKEQFAEDQLKASGGYTINISEKASYDLESLFIREWNAGRVSRLSDGRHSPYFTD